MDSEYMIEKIAKALGVDPKQVFVQEVEELIVVTVGFRQAAYVMEVGSDDDGFIFIGGTDRIEIPYESELAIEMTPNEFLDFLRNASWDRPSAVAEYLHRTGYSGPSSPNDEKGEGLVGIRPLRISMYRDGDDEETLQWLREVFGGEIPPVLLEEGWDT